MILYVVEFPEGFPEGDLSSPKKGPNPGFGAVTRGLSPTHVHGFEHFVHHGLVGHACESGVVALNGRRGVVASPSRGECFLGVSWPWRR